MCVESAAYREGSVGDGADAHLQGGAVLHERRNVLADLRLGGRGRLRLALDDGVVAPYRRIKLADVHDAVAWTQRHDTRCVMRKSAP